VAIHSPPLLDQVGVGRKLLVFPPIFQFSIQQFFHHPYKRMAQAQHRVALVVLISHRQLCGRHPLLSSVGQLVQVRFRTNCLHSSQIPSHSQRNPQQQQQRLMVAATVSAVTSSIQGVTSNTLATVKRGSDKNVIVPFFLYGHLFGQVFRKTLLTTK
jgi:hypothetical protein